MIPRNTLQTLYGRGLSSTDIALKLRVSINKVMYWMNKHQLQRRSISEAIYLKRNPHGDPFHIRKILSKYDDFLRGLGLGLFWGEGMKTKHSEVRLGNTDPFLILQFRNFLERICGVPREKIRYSLQVFGDISKEEAIRYWSRLLSVQQNQLGKVSLVKLRGKGTYKRKNRYGVLQIACHNTKLKAIIDNMLSTLKKRAVVAQLAEHAHGGAPIAPPAQISRN